jgi:hypothetical protein
LEDVLVVEAPIAVRPGGSTFSPVEAPPTGSPHDATIGRQGRASSLSSAMTTGDVTHSEGRRRCRGA